MPMGQFQSRREYLDALELRAGLPEGFRRAVASLHFTAPEMGAPDPMKMNLAAVVSDEPLFSFAGVFTKNRFPGAPVLLARERVRGERAQAILVNNKVANVGAPQGIADAEQVLKAFGDHLEIDPQLVIPASTGVIGWSLPVREMRQALPALCSDLHDGSLLPVAQAIMTTDAYPKVRSIELGSGRIVGIAKGAGMIEPNLATLLAFFLTDLEIPRYTMQSLLRDTCEASFNRISIDGDQSTSDMALMLSSGRRPAVAEHELQAAMIGIARGLADDIVRNGEGTGHVIRVVVEHARAEREAVILGKAVINSPLVKAAIFGNDPNVGRIAAAVGDCAGNHDIALDPGYLSIAIADEQVLAGGRFLLDSSKERRLSAYLKRSALRTETLGYPEHDQNVEITVSCGVGAFRAEVLGSDLSYEYVRENADYRS